MSTSSFPTIIYSGLNHFSVFLCYSYSFFLCPHIFFFIYTVHDGCLYVTDTLSRDVVLDQLFLMSVVDKSCIFQKCKSDYNLFYYFFLWIQTALNKQILRKNETGSFCSGSVGVNNEYGCLRSSSWHVFSVSSCFQSMYCIYDSKTFLYFILKH